MHVIIVKIKQCGIDWLFRNHHECKIWRKKTKFSTLRRSLDWIYCWFIVYVFSIYKHFETVKHEKNDWLSTIHGNALENGYNYNANATHRNLQMLLIGIYFNRFVDNWKWKIRIFIIVLNILWSRAIRNPETAKIILRIKWLLCRVRYLHSGTENWTAIIISTSLTQ